MDDVFVAQLMSSDLETVGPDTPVEAAAEQMQASGVGSLVVVDDDNRLLGVLTTTDFVDIVAKSKPKARTTVERYMTTDVLTTTAQASVVDAADLLLEHRVHHLPVVDDEEGVVGIITTTDLTAYVSSVRTPSPA